MLSDFHNGHGITLPPINFPPILYRWLRLLALPIEVFAATSRLGRLLQVDSTFKVDAKPGATDALLNQPEVYLMAMLVVTTKLLFPFDDVERHPRSYADVSALKMDWLGWAELQQVSGRDAESIKYSDALKFSQDDVMTASQDHLDQYMDWVEQHMATEDIRERGNMGKDADFRRALFRMFPADRKSDLSSSSRQDMQHNVDLVAQRIRQVQVRLRPAEIVEDSSDEVDGVNRMGDFYRRTRRLEELSGPLQVLHERAATLVGLSLESMIKAVSLVEGRVQRHEEKLRNEEET
jgi:RNA polymerase I-specific transcription initiation factor RRN7